MYSTFVNVGPSYNLYSLETYFWTLRTRPWDFEKLSAKTRNWLGEAFSGMITTLFRGHFEQYLYTLARTHHTVLWKQTLLCRRLGFRGVGKLLACLL